MSGKPVILLFHGMGVHTADSFKKEVVDAANKALSRYDGYKTEKFENKAIIHSIEYDSIFNDHRKKLAENAKGIQAALGTLSAVNIPSIIAKLADFEAKFGEDKFEYTHVLDVVLYMTIVGQQVRAHVTEQIMKYMKQYGPETPVHIVAHSLGTAVVHDSLNQLFTNDASPNDNQLYTGRHKIKSLWTFANVSRLVTTFTGLPGSYDSLVKPGDNGCVGMFYNVFNVFDPFTLKPFKRFDPKPEYNWVHPNVYNHYYTKIRTQKVSRLNTHDVAGYIEDPLVCHDFLNTFFDFFPSDEAITKGDAQFKHVEGEFEKIKDFIDEIDDAGDLVEFLAMLKAFQDYIKGLTNEA